MENFLSQLGKYSLTIILTAIVTILLMQKCSGDNPQDTKTIYNYKTDTIFSEKPFKAPKELKNKVNPREVIYSHDTLWLSQTQIEIRDSIIFIENKATGDTTKLNDSFLKLYPKSNKLISIKLDKDTMTLSMLDINGKTKSEIYPVYFDKFKYVYVDNQLSYEAIKNKSTNKNINGGMYGNAGYSLLQKSAVASLEYQLNVKRLKIALEATSTIQNQPQLLIIGKVGFKIF